MSRVTCENKDGKPTLICEVCKRPMEITSHFSSAVTEFRQHERTWHQVAGKLRDAEVRKLRTAWDLIEFGDPKHRPFKGPAYDGYAGRGSIRRSNHKVKTGESM